MPIPFPAGFDITNNDPIDARITVASPDVRKAFDPDNVYPGLIVYEQSSGKLYKLVGANPSQDSNWKEIPDSLNLSLTQTITGVSASYTGKISLVASSSGAATASLTDGLVWIVAGEDRNDYTGSNGETWIWSSGSRQWYFIPKLDQAAGDARYLKLLGGTLKGNVTINSGFKITGTSSFAESASNAYMSANVAGGTQYYIPVWGNNNTNLSSSGIYQNSNGIGIFNTNPQYPLDITGSTRISGSVYLPSLTQQSKTNVVLIDTASGQLYYTASSAIGGGGTGTGTITGGGRDGYIPFFSGSNTNISSSIMYQTSSIGSLVFNLPAVQVYNLYDWYGVINGESAFSIRNDWGINIVSSTTNSITFDNDITLGGTYPIPQTWTGITLEDGGSVVTINDPYYSDIQSIYFYSQSYDGTNYTVFYSSSTSPGTVFPSTIYGSVNTVYTTPSVQLSGDLKITGDIKVNGSIYGNLNPALPLAYTLYLNDNNRTLYTTDSAIPTATKSIFLGIGSNLVLGNNHNDSIFMGIGAGINQLTGSNAIIIGQFAGNGGKNYQNSVLIGNYAGKGDSNRNTIEKSVHIGHLVGYLSETQNSVFIGHVVGGFVTSSYSTLIGYNVASQRAIDPKNKSIGDNNIIIGTNLTLKENTKDSINIGGLIFATGSYFNTGSIPFSGSSMGKVGINMFPPTYSFQVSGTVGFNNLTTDNNVSHVLMYNTSSGQLFYTASSAIGGGGSGNGFPFSGNAVITGSLLISGSGTNSTNTLRIIGSGSANPLFSILGSQGDLFSATDSLSGSLFSVNNSDGTSTIEVFSDSTVLMGNYRAPALYTTVGTAINTGIGQIIYQLPTASYWGAFYDYTIKSGSVGRVGNIMAMWSGSSVNFTEVSASSFGTTTGFKFGVIVTGSNMALTGSATTDGWIIRTIIRSI